MSQTSTPSPSVYDDQLLLMLDHDNKSQLLPINHLLKDFRLLTYPNNTHKEVQILSYPNMTQKEVQIMSYPNNTLQHADWYEEEQTDFSTAGTVGVCLCVLGVTANLLLLGCLLKQRNVHPRLVLYQVSVCTFVCM